MCFFRVIVDPTQRGDDGPLVDPSTGICDIEIAKPEREDDRGAEEKVFEAFNYGWGFSRGCCRREVDGCTRQQ